jgi:hypothetical protein
MQESSMTSGDSLTIRTSKAILPLTTSAKRVGVGAAFQPWIVASERSSLQTRIATTESGSLCVRMKS